MSRASSDSSEIPRVRAKARRVRAVMTCRLTQA